MPVNYKSQDRDYLAAARRNENYLRGARGAPEPKATADYHPQTVLGVCARCKRLGTVKFPPGTFDWNTADNLMDRRKVSIYCPQCNRETEFVPVPPDKDPQDTIKWLQREEKRLRNRELGGRPDPVHTTNIF